MSTKILLEKSNFLQKINFFHVNLGLRKCSNSILHILTSKPIGNNVLIKGWIKSSRKMKDMIFVDVNDGSSSKSLQVLFPKQLKPENLSIGASIDVMGKLQMTDKGQLEVFADSVKIFGGCFVKDDYPFTPKQNHSSDYVRQYLHLRPRLNHFSSLLRIRHLASFKVHEFFYKNGFFNINTPILTGNDCEGAGETFKAVPDNQNLLVEMAKPDLNLDEVFFDSKAYLTVSGQLHLEAAVRALTKVYTFGPTFRAENSKSRLHLSEFYMIEGEEAFTESLQDVMTTVENLVKYMTQEIVSTMGDDILTILKLNKTDHEQHLNMISKIINSKFIIMDYDEVLKILEKHEDKFQNKTSCTEGISKEHELFLAKYSDGIPVFVINWPKEIKPFYMKECDHDSNKVASFDLLVPNVGEVCGGSLREDDYDKLKEKINVKSLKWYLDLRKYGNVPSGGFGLGFERYLQFLLDIQNIKDTLPFPRWPHSLIL